MQGGAALHVAPVHVERAEGQGPRQRPRLRGVGRRVEHRAAPPVPDPQVGPPALRVAPPRVQERVEDVHPPDRGGHVQRRLALVVLRARGGRRGRGGGRGRGAGPAGRAGGGGAAPVPPGARARLEVGVGAEQQRLAEELEAPADAGHVHHAAAAVRDGQDVGARPDQHEADVLGPRGGGPVERAPPLVPDRVGLVSSVEEIANHVGVPAAGGHVEQRRSLLCGGTRAGGRGGALGGGVGARPPPTPPGGRRGEPGRGPALARPRVDRPCARDGGPRTCRLERVVSLLLPPEEDDGRLGDDGQGEDDRGPEDEGLGARGGPDAVGEHEERAELDDGLRQRLEDGLLEADEGRGHDEAVGLSGEQEGLVPGAEVPVGGADVADHHEAEDEGGGQARQDHPALEERHRDGVPQERRPQRLLQRQRERVQGPAPGLGPGGGARRSPGEAGAVFSCSPAGRPTSTEETPL